MTQIESLLGDAASFTDRDVIDRSLALARAAGPTDRNRFSPGHFTASGFVVSADGASLLLIHHKRLDRWLQPGGHIDPGDASPLAAAAREVREETGVDTEPISDGLIDVDIHRIPARSPEPEHEHFDLRFAFRALGDDLVADDEVFDVTWVPWGDLEGYRPDASMRRAVAALREACS